MVKLDDTGAMEWCDLDKVYELSEVSDAMGTCNTFMDSLAKMEPTAAHTMKNIVDGLDGEGVIFLAGFLKQQIYEGALSFQGRVFGAEVSYLYPILSPTKLFKQGDEIDEDKLTLLLKSCLKGNPASMVSSSNPHPSFSTALFIAYLRIVFAGIFEKNQNVWEEEKCQANVKVKPLCWDSKQAC
jgi:hypothetical protein